MVASSKHKILNKIKQALQQSVPVPFPDQQKATEQIFHSPTQTLDITFAEQFAQLQGKFIFCNNVAEMKQQLQQLIINQQWKTIFCNEDQIIQLLHQQNFPLQNNNLPNCDASITSCEALVARTGSIVLSAAQAAGRTASVYAPIHICIAYTKQLVYDIKDALLFMQEKYGKNLPSLITFATGPSRTADIEKTLVVGVHGPKEVYVFLVDEASNDK